MAVEEHRSRGPRQVRLAILTVSDTRGTADDASGALARRLLEGAGHRVFEYRVLPDEPEAVREQAARWLEAEGCDGILVNGGTGIAARDRTYEAIAGLLEKRLDGFGELFHWLSYQRIGSAAMLSRSIAGTVRGRVVFAVPGSPEAVRLALEELILPEIGHVVGELRKDEPPGR